MSNTSPCLRILSSRKNELSQVIAWLLVISVSLVSIVSWGNFYQWHIVPFSAYQFFPVLGLLAFSIMWSHYMMAALRNFWSLDRSILAKYFRWTGYVVLALICLHPGLLIYQRFRDGYGLPPGSYEHYVAPGLGWITILGTASLFVFLAFELHRFFGKRSWWHYVADASDAAMLAIIYHALRLGSNLQQGWLRGVWWFYLATLVVVLMYKYALRLRSLVTAYLGSIIGNR